MRFDFTVEKKILKRRGKILFPRTIVKDIHVYEDSEEEAIIILKLKGYKVVENV
jgi:hypothetical protein